MITVYSADTQIDAQLVCDALLAEGIDAFVSGGYLAGAAGDLPVGALISVRIRESSQYQRARVVVHAFESSAGAGTSVRCTRCGETVDGEFSHCWNCGEPVASGKA